MCGYGQATPVARRHHQTLLEPATATTLLLVEKTYCKQNDIFSPGRSRNQIISETPTKSSILLCRSRSHLHVILEMFSSSGGRAGSTAVPELSIAEKGLDRWTVERLLLPKNFHPLRSLFTQSTQVTKNAKLDPTWGNPRHQKSAWNRLPLNQCAIRDTLHTRWTTYATRGGLGGRAKRRY